MGPAPPLMTAHEYFKTPETVKPMELAFGALRVADAPSAKMSMRSIASAGMIEGSMAQMPSACGGKRMPSTISSERGPV